MIQFVLGAVAGGLAAWWWRGDIQNYVDQRLPNVRRQTADRLSAIEQRAEQALGRAKSKIEQIRPNDASHEITRQPGNYTHGTGV